MWRRQRKSEAPAATLTLTGRPDRPTEQQDGSWGAGPAHPFPPGPSEVSKVPAWGGGREGAQGCGVMCGPLWRLLGQVGQGGGLCRPTACAPAASRPWAAAHPFPPFPLAPSSLSLPLPVWPPLTPAPPEPLVGCSREGRGDQGRPSFSLLWPPRLLVTAVTGTQWGFVWPEAQVSLDPSTLERRKPFGLGLWGGGSLGCGHHRSSDSGLPAHVAFRPPAPREAGLRGGGRLAGFPRQLWLRPVDLVGIRNHLTPKGVPAGDSVRPPS